VSRWCSRHPYRVAAGCPDCLADHAAGEHQGRPVASCRRCREQQADADTQNRITDARRRQAHDTPEDTL
jgi:hypothetical protein